MLGGQPELAELGGKADKVLLGPVQFVLSLCAVGLFHLAVGWEWFVVVCNKISASSFLWGGSQWKEITVLPANTCMLLFL